MLNFQWCLESNTQDDYSEDEFDFDDDNGRSAAVDQDPFHPMGDLVSLNSTSSFDNHSHRGNSDTKDDGIDDGNGG